MFSVNMRSVKDRALCAHHLVFGHHRRRVSSCRGIRTFVFRPTGIPRVPWRTPSRWRHGLLEKITYYGGEPERGDIVTFEDPEIPSRILIKRVIATGRETVDLVDGQVVVDGSAPHRASPEGKPSNPITPAYGTEIVYPYTVPEGELWVMGDNRTNSQDSRYFGSIDESTVTGRAVFRYCR